MTRFLRGFMYGGIGVLAYILTQCAYAQAQTVQLQSAWRPSSESAQCYLRARFDPATICYLQENSLAGRCAVNFFGFAWWNFNSFSTGGGRWHQSITLGSTVMAESDWCEGPCGLASNVYQYDLLYHGNTGACWVSGTAPSRTGNTYWEYR